MEDYSLFGIPWQIEMAEKNLEEPPGPPIPQFPVAGHSGFQGGQAADRGVSQTSPEAGKGTPI